MAEVVSELAAKDRLSFKQIADSHRIHEAFKRYGFHIPKRPHAVRELVMEFYKEIKDHVKNQIQELLKLNKRFSLTSDEWTALMNRRFMNINVHSEGGLTLNLGMVGITGSMPAEVAKELTEKRLQEFGINLMSDIVCSSTDGASVMVKYGKLLDPVMHMQCYNHAYHLAVIAFLYKSEVQEDIEEELEDDIETDEEWDESMDDDDYAPELNETIQELVKKVRTVVKLFRRSPVKNDKYLQPRVMADPKIGHRLNLIMDSKTRYG